MQSFVRSKWTTIAFFLITFLIALFVRAWGADHGIFHGDERINSAARALAGELVPGQHFYPPFVNYLNAVALLVLFAFGLIAGWWNDTGTFRDQYFADPTAFYIAARLMTALTGALMAPIFYLVARRLQFDHLRSFGIAMIGAFFPLAVFMATIAKGDTGLATSVVALIWAIIWRVQAGPSWRIDLLVGVCVVLCLSFKHSAIFILFPLAVVLFVAITRQENLRSSFASLGTAVLVIVVLVPLFNIGLFLDLKGFLAYQEIQSVMSVQPEGGATFVGPTTLFLRSFEIHFGINPVMTVLVLLTPLLLLRKGSEIPHKTLLVFIWLSLAFGTFVVTLLVGPRQPEHLWIANFAGFLLLAGLALADLSRASQAMMRVAALGLFAGAMVMSVYGTAETIRQARAVPVHQAVGAYLQGSFADRRIVTSVPLVENQRKEAQQRGIARTDRLAAKYNVEMPPRAAQGIIQVSAPDALFYVNMPLAFYGLENVEEDDVTYEVQPHAWPLQSEEWTLDYWLDAGFTVFVVRDFPNVISDAYLEIQRDFYREVNDACTPTQQFEATKTLLLERTVQVFDCAN
ncbi:ArnT family glycosyltransferase [Loktanella sp. Alg231-35]|uniref:ArnT family glycosyltransferase n=1 Tax=Loktanella sp. Alg231-35 TaxID=1922220 RepID=UPI00131EFEB4|nr:hypothetical protein [Loktanella sp. Alg231-35]